MKIVSISLFLILPIFVMGQKQLGHVKTCGSIDEKGVPLAGVLITPDSANSTKSAVDGTFNLTLSGKQNGNPYKIADVYLKSYVLLEKNFCSKMQIFSEEVPLEISMISRDELAKIQSETEENIRVNIEKNYKEREEELIRKLRNKELEIEKYQVEFENLQKQKESTKDLIDEMVEKYSRTDFDNLDSLDAKIIEFIRIGKLSKAKELINRKGSIEDRFTNAMEEGRIIIEDEKRIEDETRRNRLLKDSNIKIKEELINDYYNLFSIAVQKSEMDSAAYFLEKRALLDMLNFDNVFFYANFIGSNFLATDDSIKRWYHIALDLANNNLLRSKVISKLANLYFHRREFDSAESSFLELIDIYNKPSIYGDEQYKKELAITLNNIACLYMIEAHNDKAKDSFKKSTDILNSVIEDSLLSYNPIISILKDNDQGNDVVLILGGDNNTINKETEVNYISKKNTLFCQYESRFEIIGNRKNSELLYVVYSNLAYLYESTDKIIESTNYYSLATNKLTLSIENIFEISNIFTSLVRTQSASKKYFECEKSISQLLDIYSEFFNANSLKNTNKISEAFLKLGNFLKKLKHFDVSEISYIEAIKIYKELVKNDRGYRSELANAHNKLAVVQSNLQKYDSCENNLKESIKIRKELFLEDSTDYGNDLVISYMNLALLQQEIEQYSESEISFIEAIKIYKELIKNDLDYRSELANAQNKLAVVQSNLQKYDSCEINLKKSLEIQKELFIEAPLDYGSDFVITYMNLALLQQEIEQYSESEISFIEAIKIYKDLVKNDLGYRSELANAYNKLAVVQSNLQKYDSCGINLKESIKIRKELFLEDSTDYGNDLVISYMNLALLQQEIEQYSESEISFIEAIKIYKELVKNDLGYRSELANAHNKLAIVQSNLQEWDSCVVNLKESLEIRKKLFMEDSTFYDSDLASTYLNLALIQQKVLQNDEAEISFIEALNIYEKLATVNKDFIIGVAKTLSELSYLQHTKKLQKAIENNKNALQIYQDFKDSIYNIDSDYAISLCDMSFFQLLDNEYIEAELYARKSIEKDNTLVFARKNLAHTLLFQGKFEEALSYYVDLFKDHIIQERVLQDFDELEKAGITHPDVAKIRTLLAN